MKEQQPTFSSVIQSPASFPFQTPIHLSLDSESEHSNLLSEWRSPEHQRTAVVMDDTREPSSSEANCTIVSETRCGRLCRCTKALFAPCFPTALPHSQHTSTSLHATNIPLPQSKRRVTPKISIQSLCKVKEELFVVYEQRNKTHSDTAIDISQEAVVLN